MTNLAIPFSVALDLWRQAQWAWGSNSDGSPSDLWRHYIQAEIAQRTIAAQAHEIAALKAALAEAQSWEPVEAYSEVYVVADDDEKYTIGVDGDDTGYILRRSDNSIACLPDNWQLMRRVNQAQKGGANDGETN